MSGELEAARRELRQSLAVARASLAQVRRRPMPVMDHEVHDPDLDLEVSDVDL